MENFGKVETGQNSSELLYTIHYEHSTLNKCLDVREKRIKFQDTFTFFFMINEYKQDCVQSSAI